MKFSINYLLVATAFAYLLFMSCKKFVTVDQPPNSITRPFVFSTDANATSAVLALYIRIMETSKALSGGFGSISALTSLSSDELISYHNGTALIEIGSNSILQTNATVNAKWTELYKSIYDANGIIEGLNNSIAVSRILKSQLEGEAKFIRALAYFYLSGIFGDVPLLLTTNYKDNASAFRTKKNQIYQHIVDDLVDIQTKLSDSYLLPSNTAGIERIRPNRFAVAAFLARMYLYKGDWINAEKQASIILNNKELYDTVSIDSVFLRNTKEAIWQLQPVGPGLNTFDAVHFILTTMPSSISTVKNSALNSLLINSFEPGDKRKTKWIGSVTVAGNIYYYPFKYKIYLANQPVTEYEMVFRVSEQYLIRAEARIQQGRIAEGVADLNVLRRRARALPTLTIPDPLPALATTLSKEEAILAVENERRHELFTEWGHRWFDLKRTGRADIVMGAAKGGNWQTTDDLWPIPLSEIGLNPNLRPQNAGYN